MEEVVVPDSDFINQRTVDRVVHYQLPANCDIDLAKALGE
jgi:hypothetical protein